MLLRRIDDLVTGGGSLDLHPRLTVVRAAGPETRRRIEAVVRAIATGAPSGAEPPPPATIELSGVQLALDAATLERLGIDHPVDPVLVLGSAPSTSGPPLRPSAAAPTPSAGPAAPPHRDAPSLDDLRAQLRTVGEQRTELGDRMEAARSRLDSFSTAALEVCVGQIEALESRRAELRSAVDRHHRELAERRRVLGQAIDRLRSDFERSGRPDVARVPAARAALVAAVDAPVPPDPAAIELADQLDAALHRFRRVHADRAAAELRVDEARQRLDVALAQLESVRRSERGGGDPETVRRLEEVREEIFRVGDRSARRAPGRAKRRLHELRAEEAVLLDRLGFDTYSAYVMGISTVRAEVERSNRIDRAEAEVERIRDELDDLLRDRPDDAELERVAAELDGLVSVATRELDPVGAPARPAELDPEVRTELVYDLIEALRNRRLSPTGVDDPRVRAAADELHAALVDATPSGPGSSAPAPPPASAPVEDLLAAADAWTSWERGLASWRREASARLGELEAELAELDAADGPAAVGDAGPVAEWAELEAALDAALDRLAVAQERARVHESATAEVARLREAELDLRAHERSLLAAIAAAEDPSHAPEGPGAQVAGPGPTGGDGPAPGGPEGGRSAADGPGPDGAEWELLRRLARQRRVSFVGSLPLLVIGLGGPTARTEVLQRRLARMSDLVQVVVLSDDDDVADWARGLGGAASVVELPRRR